MNISTNWVITSPGRTGSRFISDVLTIFYKEKFGVDTQYLGPGTLFDVDAHWQMYHTHDPTQILINQKHSRSVLSIRDMVEAALSYCVVNRTKLYHVFSSTNIGEIPRVKQFHLPLPEFMEQYSYQVNFYKQAKHLIDKDTVIMRYQSILDDWRSVLWDVGFEPNTITPAIERKIQMMAPLKNHWDSKQWISNWDEINNCASTLPRNPETFFNEWKLDEDKDTKEEKNE